jgi:hypothetical protein
MHARYLEHYLETQYKLALPGQLPGYSISISLPGQLPGRIAPTFPKFIWTNQDRALSQNLSQNVSWLVVYADGLNARDELTRGSSLVVTVGGFECHETHLTW